MLDFEIVNLIILMYFVVLKNQNISISLFLLLKWNTMY